MEAIFSNPFCASMALLNCTIDLPFYLAHWVLPIIVFSTSETPKPSFKCECIRVQFIHRVSLSEWTNAYECVCVHYKFRYSILFDFYSVSFTFELNLDYNFLLFFRFISFRSDWTCEDNHIWVFCCCCCVRECVCVVVYTLEYMRVSECWTINWICCLAFWRRQQAAQ